MHIPRIMIAAASSGSGKTVITCALMEAFRQSNLNIKAYKCGPDYIDPMFHREVLGVPSENLDLFFSDQKELEKHFIRHAAGTGLAVAEGVMGYYDGMTLSSDRASSYEVALTLGFPTILVVPCKGMSLSVMPLILGMIRFRKDSGIRGIILNRIREPLYAKMKQMIETELKAQGYEIPVVGYVPEAGVFQLDSRHLGLVLPQETDGLKEQLRRTGEILKETIDLSAILEIADSAPDFADPKDEGVSAALRQESSVRLAVAQDEAFCFYYEDNLEMLESFGCEIVPFSPLHDRKLPEDVQGLWLGGGYPEVYAKELSGNTDMTGSICREIERGLPCIAECGGFLYLHRELEGTDGTSYPMAAVFEEKAYRTERLRRFGYITLHANADGGFLQEGEEIRGHEFHYWDSENNGTDCMALKPDGKRSWECIHMTETLFAGFPHLYLPSDPAFVRRFLEKCRAYMPKREENKF